MWGISLVSCDFNNALTTQRQRIITYYIMCINLIILLRTKLSALTENRVIFGSKNKVLQIIIFQVFFLHRIKVFQKLFNMVQRN